MRTSETVQSIMPALLELHRAMPDVKKTREARVPTKKGGTYTYKYADISDILEAIRPVLTSNGMLVTQDTASVEGGLQITTRLWHSSGEWLESEPIVMPANTQDAQSIGAASTYGRRYSLSALLAIAADEDTDGQGAQATTPKNQSNTVQEPNWQNDDSAKRAIWAVMQEKGYGVDHLNGWLSDMEVESFNATTTEQRRNLWLWLKGE